MFAALLILQVVLGVAIIALVLLQQGKGADMGAAFGAGASGTVFGAKGGGSFLTRTTAILATLFFINSVLLSSPLVREERHPTASVVDRVPLAGEAAEEAQSPSVEDKAAEEETDLPPVDLPEVPQEGDTSDLPPADEPAAGAEQPAAKEPAAESAGGSDATKSE